MPKNRNIYFSSQAEGGLTDALEPKRVRCDSAPALIGDVKDRETADNLEANHVTNQPSGDMAVAQPQSLSSTLRFELY